MKKNLNTFALAAVAVVLINLALLAGVVYVAVHFIMKFW